MPKEARRCPTKRPPLAGQHAHEFDSIRLLFSRTLARWGRRSGSRTEFLLAGPAALVGALVSTSRAQRVTRPIATRKY